MKNTDYSASAVKLCNPESIGFLLAQYHAELAAIQTLNDEIQKLIPKELTDKIAEYQKSHSECEVELRKVIEEQGSYQDLEKGWYAVKQRKVSKSYNAEAFEKTYPQYAPAIIIKAVDTTKLNGLLKGGLITEQDLRKRMPAFAEDTVGNDPIMHESESFAYIIK